MFSMTLTRLRRRVSLAQAAAIVVSSIVLCPPAAAQLPPTADAGPHQSVVEGSSVTLDGSASSDPNPALIDTSFQRDNLPGGTALEVGLERLGNSGELVGSASIGEGPAVARTAIAYVLDVSGSSNDAGGCGGDQNNDRLSNRIIDCEIAAALKLHQEVISSSTVAQIGLVTFSSGASVRDLNPTAAATFLISPTADADGNGVLDLEQSLRTLRAGGSTNFRAAVSAACNLLAGAQASNRLAVFISDGESTTGGAAINILPCNPPVQFEGFAIGTGNSCTGGSAGSRLQEIAARTGGTCTNVRDASSLPDILPEIIGSQLTRATLTVDGGAPIDISASFSPPLPLQGPASATFGAPLPQLADGIHDVCVRVYGSDALGEGSVESCSRLRVGNAPLSYEWKLIEQSGPPIVLSSASAPRPSFQVPDDARYLFELTVTNGFGLSAIDQVEVTVSNREPELDVKPGEGFAGGVTLLSASFTDSGYIDIHEAEVDWGDGTIDSIPVTVQGSGWGGFFGSHIYAQPGQYDVTLRVTDDDGGSAETRLDQFQIGEPVAVWANSTSAPRSLDWSGASGKITGRVHSNNELRFVGSTKTVLGQATYGRTLSADTDRHIFSKPPVAAPVQDFPVRHDLAAYRPGGDVETTVGAAYHDMSGACASGRWHETQTVLAEGVYYANCDIQLNGSLIGGRVTVVSEGSIHVYGSRPAFEPYHDGLLFLAGGAGDKAIDIAASRSRFLGVLFAERGEIDLSGSENRFFCGILGDRVDMSGGGLQVRGANCGRPDSTVAGPLLVPSLALDLSAAPADVLPGQAVTFSLNLSHEGATLVVPGLLGLENVDSAPVQVASYTYFLEYFSVADQAWVPFASNVDGAPGLGGLEVTLRGNPFAGVTFPASGNAVLGTSVAPGGFATWGSEAVVTLSPEVLGQLLDPAVTGGIRNRVSFTTSPANLQVRRLFTTGSDFIAELRALGANATNAEITLTQPSGDPLIVSGTPALGLLTPGDSVPVEQVYTVPVIAPRSGGETDAAYIARLLTADGTLLYGSASARATGGVGLLAVPVQLAFSTERVPAVSLTSSGPDLVFPGARLQYQYRAQNLGGTAASAVTLNNRLGSDPAPVSPPLPATMIPGQIASATYGTDVPANTPAGTLRNLATLGWRDAAGNLYGEVEAEIVTTVADPPQLKTTLRDVLRIDADGNGLVSPGDTVGYEAVISNVGDLPVEGVSFTVNADPNGALVPGLVTTSRGTVVNGNQPEATAVTVAVGSVGARSSVTIAFATLLVDPLPDNVASTTLQATVTATGLDPHVSDDPDVFGVNDVTVTQIAVPNPVLNALLSVALAVDGDGNGVASAGDQLTYTLKIENAGTASAINTRIEIPVPTATRLVAGSLTTTVGTIREGSSGSDTKVAIEIASAEPSRTDQIQFSVAIGNPINPPVDAITSRAQVSADNVITLFSDDPSTPEENDDTSISVRIDPGVGGGGGSGGGGSGGGAGSGTAGQGSADFNNGIPGATPSNVSPVSGATITAPTLISANLTPPAGETVTGWTVYVRPLGSTELIEIASGSGPGVTATFDPTVYTNGLYGVVIESTTSNGGLVRSESYVTVEGDFKPGRIQFTLTDLDVNIDRLPIRIERSYDSFSRERGDFGVAWSLDVADFSIQTNGFLGAGGWRQEIAGGALFVSYLDYVTDKPHFVVVTWPDGTVERFDLKPAQSVSLFPYLTSAVFVPRDGATSKLEALDSSLFFANDGNLYGGLFGSGGLYNPQRFKLTDRSGTSYIIDRTRGLLSGQDTNGNTLTVSSNGISHSLGVQIQFVRDGSGRITRIVDNQSGTINYAYDAIGNLVSVTDQAGELTTYEYDPVLKHHLVRVSDAEGVSTQAFQYDAQGRLIGLTDALGESMATSYDPGTLTFTATDRRGFQTTEIYDESGNLARIEYPDGSTRQFRYDDPNNPFLVTAETNENGDTTEKLFTPAGDLREVIYPDGTRATMTYDANGRVTSVTDAGGNVRTFQYDAKGNLLRFVNEVGEEVVSTYDGSGRLVSVTLFSGAVTRIEYPSGYPFPNRIINADGTSRDVAYDLAGRLTFLRDENGNVSRMGYTANGAPRFLETGGERVDYEYEGGKLVRLSTTAGGEVRFTYDALGQLVRRENELGQITAFAYDANGNRISVTDESGNVTRFVYDERNRLVEEIDPLNKRTTYRHDPVGYLVEQTDPKGQRRLFDYDAVGNLIRETWLDTAGTTVRVVDTQHDATGNVLRIGDGTSAFEYAYDGLGRVVRATDLSVPGGPWVLDYQYGPGGGLVGVTDQTGVSVSADLNSERLIESLTWSGAAVDPVGITFDYSPVGQITGVQRFSGGLTGALASTSTYLRNSEFRATDITHNNAANTPVARYTYEYDALSQLRRETGPSGERTYDYDALGQLLSAIATGALPDETFAYDAAGNRIDGQTLIGPANQVLRTADEQFVYDASGNLARRISSATGESSNYRYNHIDQLVAVDFYNAAGHLIGSVRYTYDVYGRVVAHTSDPDGVGPLAPQTRYSTYSGVDLWADLDPSGSAVSRYLFRPSIDEPLARYRPGDGAAFYLTDHLGSVRAIVDEAGNVLNQVDYSSFGVPILESNPLDGDRLKYTAREYDADLGLYDYRSRHYDPALGRFISPDSVGFESGDLNLYRYVFNAPHEYTDPFGTTASTDYAALLRTAKTAAIRCIGNISTTLIKEAATELLVLYAIRQVGAYIPYVGRTGRAELDGDGRWQSVRFGEHRRSKRFGGALERIGEFDVRIPKMKNPEHEVQLIRLIEQLVMDEFKGETKLLNARNEVNKKDFDNYREFFCEGKGK